MGGGGPGHASRAAGGNRRVAGTSGRGALAGAAGRGHGRGDRGAAAGAGADTPVRPGVSGITTAGPAGVPIFEMNSMTAATGKIIWPVVPFCLTSLLTAN